MLGALLDAQHRLRRSTNWKEPRRRGASPRPRERTLGERALLSTAKGLYGRDFRPFERGEAPTRLGAQGTTAAEGTTRGPSLMYAHKGDRLVVPSERPREPAREAEILGFRNGDGSPPFHVRWCDTGHEGLCFPGPNAFVIHLEQSGADN